MTRNISLLILTVFAFLNLQKVSGQKPRLDYMSKNSSDFIFNLSKFDKKPVLVFVHSVHCYTSRQFVREVMNKEDVMQTIRMNFNCMNADVSEKNGKSYADKNNLMLMPVLVLYSHDADMKYRCQLKLDKSYILEQLRNFLSACNIKNQIKMLSSTNENLDVKTSSSKIGESYARIDYRKRTTLSEDMSKNIARFTLNMKYFKDFEDGYKREWEKLQMKKEETHPE
ncbi:MAG: thioredoxin family protein [Bacteroidetes bacterium]|nr:thioredoxin family protein [Bacteroidota bacterium]